MEKQTSVSEPLVPPTLPRWWRVIPSMFLLLVIANLDNLILNDFIVHRYANRYQQNSSATPNTRDICLNASRTPHNNHSISTTTSRYPVSTTLSPDDLIQASTARLNVYMSLAATIPSILTSILLGANCDRVGRKPLIILPYIGKIIRYFILTAVAYYDLADWWILLAIISDSIFGTSGLTILSTFAYVSDCTNEKTRTSAIIITDVFMVGSRLIPLLTMGIYLQHPRFTQSMVFTLLLSLAGFILSIVTQPESKLNVRHLNFLQQLAQMKLRETTKIFRVFLAKRQEHKQRSLLLLVGAHLWIIVMIYGNMAMNYLYLYGVPFCLDSLGVSLINIAQTVSMVLLTIPFTLLVTNRTDHLSLPILACLAYIAQLVLYGIAKQVWMIYLAVCIGSIFAVLVPVIRSRMTKLVEPNEYAVVFILASILESGGSYAIIAMVNEIYGASLTFYPGLVFFVLAIFGGVAIVLMLILYGLEHRSVVVPRKLTLNE